MKLPISWLSEYIDISDMSVQELSDKITFAGIEIEGIEQVGTCFDNIVAGKVIECANHPDSDHLHVTKVFDGETEVQVVCGAPNCRAGLIVPFAKVGAVMPDGTKIKKGKLRGVESFGMLCSGRELGITQENAGIMEMDTSIEPGTPLEKLFGSTETVFDVEITWNRPDCLSIIGIAREFAAILKRPLKMPDVSFPETADNAADLCRVNVLNSESCPVYTARVLPHVERLPSPEWMSKRLELCGMRSIDIVVDVSNYVMLECGQPLHTFDYECVADHTINVRNANNGEVIKTLDDVERKLDPSMLVIADSKNALAIAGVMGGEGSEIRPQTSSVLLESANFYAPSVKSTATKLGMRTESSHRFERGVDPFLPDWASRRACALLVKYANATVASGMVQQDSRDASPREITLRFNRANEIIGMNIPVEEQISILTGLNFKLKEKNAEFAIFEAPTYRIDAEVEADLIEEIARMNGLEALPDVMPSTKIVPEADDSIIRAASFCRKTLASLGFTEALHYSFTAPAILDAFSPSAAPVRIVLPNPVSADYSIMRDSLIPQMINTMGYNHSHEVTTARMFEMGRVFFRSESGKLQEEDRICVALMGFAGRKSTDCTRAVESSESVLWLKGAMESLIAQLHAPLMKLEPEDAEGFEPGFAAKIIIAGRDAGRIGIISKAIRQKHRISSPLAIAEIKRDSVLTNAFKVVAAKDVPAFPGTSRDIALIAKDGITHDQIVQTIKKAAPKELVAVKLFDIFSGKSIGEGKTSLAYSLEYRSSEKTLRDEEVNAFHDKIKDSLKTKLQVEIREG